MIVIIKKNTKSKQQTNLATKKFGKLEFKQM